MSTILLTILLPLTLIFIMLGMGMTLTPADFWRLRQYPRAIVAGLTGQLVVLPLVATLLAVLWNLRPEFAVGLVILASCPGGTTSNVVSFLARGDRSLSITLTAVNSGLVVFTIPLYVAFATHYFIGAQNHELELPVSQLMISIFAYTLVPVSAGMLLRHYAPRFCLRVGPHYDRLAALAFTFIVLLIVWNGRDNLLAILPLVGGVTITLNLLMSGIGYLMAKGLKLPRQQTITLVIEVGIQNTVLGMAVATMLHGTGEMDGTLLIVPCALYGLIMYGPAIALIMAGRRRTPTTA